MRKLFIILWIFLLFINKNKLNQGFVACIFSKQHISKNVAPLIVSAEYSFCFSGEIRTRQKLNIPNTTCYHRQKSGFPADVSKHANE